MLKILKKHKRATLITLIVFIGLVILGVVGFKKYTAPSRVQIRTEQLKKEHKNPYEIVDSKFTKAPIYVKMTHPSVECMPRKDFYKFSLHIKREHISSYRSAHLVDRQALNIKLKNGQKYTFYIVISNTGGKNHVVLAKDTKPVKAPKRHVVLKPMKSKEVTLNGVLGSSSNDGPNTIFHKKDFNNKYVFLTKKVYVNNYLESYQVKSKSNGKIFYIM